MTKNELIEKALSLGIAKAEITKCTNKAQIEALIAAKEPAPASAPESDGSDLLSGEAPKGADPVPSEEPVAGETPKEPIQESVQPAATETPAESSPETNAPSKSKPLREIGRNPVTGKPVYHVVD